MLADEDYIEHIAMNDAHTISRHIKIERHVVGHVEVGLYRGLQTIQKLNNRCPVITLDEIVNAESSYERLGDHLQAGMCVRCKNATFQTYCGCHHSILKEENSHEGIDSRTSRHCIVNEIWPIEFDEYNE